MSEANWGEEGSEPVKKKGVPTWLWFCGGGCLALVVLGVIGAALIASKVKDLGKAEKQLPELATSLPFDSPLPPELEFKARIPVPGMEMFIFEDLRGFAAILFIASASNGKQIRDKMLNEEYEGAVFGMGGRKNVRAAPVRVQGRELKAVRSYQEGGGNSEQGSRQGQSLVVEVTPEGRTEIVVVQLIRAGGDAPISDEELNAFLKPFHVGPER